MTEENIEWIPIRDLFKKQLKILVYRPQNYECIANETIKHKLEYNVHELRKIKND